MQDVTGKQIENGDLLLEIQNYGGEKGYATIHIALGGFTPLYVMVVSANRYFIESNTNCFGERNLHFHKTKAKPKNLIVIDEETANRFIKEKSKLHAYNYNRDENINLLNQKAYKKNLEELIKFSKAIKNGEDCNEFMYNLR